MKCPKCNYVSFEYLNSCRKCNLDLTAHKAELGIDFPQYSDLGLLTLAGASVEPEMEAVAVEETAMEDLETGGGEAESSTDTDILSIGEAEDGGDANVEMDDNSLDLSGGLEPAEDETSTIETEQAVEGLDNLDISPESATGGKEIDLSEIGELAEDTDTALEEEASAVEIEAEGQSADVSANVEETGPDLNADEALDALGSTDEIPLDINDVETAGAEVEADATQDLGDLDNLDIDLDIENMEESSTQEESVAEETAETDTHDMDDLDNLDIDLDIENMEKSSTQTDIAVEEKTEDTDGTEELDLSLDEIDMDLNFDDEEIFDDNEDKQN